MDSLLEAKIIERLKTVFDPEIPIDVYELGLIYDISLKDDKQNNVLITMTLTSPNCPVAESLPNDIKESVAILEEVNEVEITITFEPPWHKDMISEEGKLELGFL